MNPVQSTQQIASKLARPFAYKSMDNAIQDVDMGSRTVVFYASAFDKMDDQNDVIRKGAYARSIREWGPQSSANRRIKHCLFHDETKLPGAISELSEDSHGLRVAVKMSDTTLGNDTLQYYKDGVYNEHSIRIGYLEGRIKAVTDHSVQGGEWYDVAEVKLWHTSTVAFGSNEHTPVVGVKSIATPEDREAAMVKINQRMNALTKAIRHGSYTDDGFKQLAYDLAECQDSYNALLTVAQADKAALAVQSQQAEQGTSAILQTLQKIKLH